jgi:hypothetical protein
VLPALGALAVAPQGCAAACTVGTLAPGASASFTLVVNPKSAGSYPLSATVTGARPDPNLANNAARVTGFAGPAALSKLSIKPRSFAPRSSGPTLSLAKGARVRFRLSRDSNVRFLVQRQRRVKGKRRWVTLKGGRIERSAKTGPNTLRFSGRVRRKPLKPGRYRLGLIAHDAGGTAKAKNLSFRIARAKKR